MVVRGAAFATAFVALWAWLAIAARHLDPRWPATPPEWLRIPGMLVAVASAALGGWCVALFVTRGRGTPAPFDPPSKFVAVGPYRYMRNPMYLGGFGVLLGAGLVLRSPSIVALASVFLRSRTCSWCSTKSAIFPPGSACRTGTTVRWSAAGCRRSRRHATRSDSGPSTAHSLLQRPGRENRMGRYGPVRARRQVLLGAGRCDRSRPAGAAHAVSALEATQC